MPRPDPHVNYQLRLVKRIDGSRIVTHQVMSQPKSLNAKDKTLDFTIGTEKGAIQRARDYCRRGANRKGELPGEFLGVVLVKHSSDKGKPVSVSPVGFQVTKRHKRTVGTTVWTHYVDRDGRAYTVDPKTHDVLDPVI